MEVSAKITNWVCCEVALTAYRCALYGQSIFFFLIDEIQLSTAFRFFNSKISQTIVVKRGLEPHMSSPSNILFI